MSGNRILVVDDKGENLYLLRAMLQGNGFEVITALHGADALDRAREMPPDLIITDILMPVMDGFALCREWRKDPLLKDIPFVFYTATYTSERDRQFALSIGADRFIVKPEEPAVFLALVREVLRQVPPQSAAPAPSAPPAETAEDLPAHPPAGSPAEECRYLRQYNEALSRKLESKIESLETARNALEQNAARLGRAEARQRLVFQLLDALNRPDEGQGGTHGLLLLLKAFAEADAAGIRLRAGQDFPYREVNGFSKSFVRDETFLCARDPSGELRVDSSGFPVLECMCGNVIRGRTDPSLPFFSEGGSFWTNGTTELLASPAEREPLAGFRNRCNREGYESVALVPLRVRRETVGLLQLNCRRKGAFSPEMISFLEAVGASFGPAIAREADKS